MEAAEDAATPDMEVDVELDVDTFADKETTNPAQTAHPRKVSTQTWVTTYLNMVRRQPLIR